MVMSAVSSFIYASLLVILVIFISSSESSSSVVSCMFCEMIEESLDRNTTPAAAISHMFKKCDRMGLMEPVCTQFINENIKEVFRHMRNGVEPAAICATLFLSCEAVIEVPRAKSHGFGIRDDAIMRARAEGLTQLKTHTGNVLVDEVGAANDDYSDFDDSSIKNKGVNNELKLVTYAPNPIIYEIPRPKPGVPGKNFPVATLSPMLKSQINPPRQIPANQIISLRKGYYWYHYPWDRLPRSYLLRPAMQYVYPPNMQSVIYRYPYLPWRDYYNIYRTHPGIGNFGYNSYYQGGCGMAGCNRGCQGDGCSTDYHNEGGSEEDDDKIYINDNDKEINKQDPLEDLDLEDLEKLDQAEEETSTLASIDNLDSDKDLLEAETSNKSLFEENLQEDVKTGKL